jgi:hypothetical protein
MVAKYRARYPAFMILDLFIVHYFILFFIYTSIIISVNLGQNKVNLGKFLMCFVFTKASYWKNKMWFCLILLIKFGLVQFFIEIGWSFRKKDIASGLLKFSSKPFWYIFVCWNFVKRFDVYWYILDFVVY